MTDRDRLVNIILQAKENEFINLLYTDITAIVDYLLANGVIVPPCKVGDTVFYIDTCETAEDFGKKFVTFSQVKRISVDYEYVVLADHMIVLWRGVFLTKEEAEKKLKELNNGTL